MPITKSVGLNGANLKRDVLHVQSLLNYWRQQNGQRPIGCDGIVGPITIAAIKHFQSVKTGIVDGRVDPQGPSMKALEAEFDSYATTLKALTTLALALSYQPGLEAPALNDRELVSMLQTIRPVKLA